MITWNRLKDTTIEYNDINKTKWNKIIQDKMKENK